jgi:hypothetical protein
MNDQARLISSDLRPVDEGELTRVVLMRVENMGRRSVHPADRHAAAYLAAEVVRAIRSAHYVILQEPPAELRPSDEVEPARSATAASAPA